MKKLLPILAFLFAAVSSYGQNWNPLTPGINRYFTNSNGYLKGMRIDSLAAYGTDLHYYPFKTYRKVYSNFGVASPDTSGSWLGEDIIKKSNGTFLFPNYWNDTIVVRTQGSVGDSWLFFHDNTNVYYTAELTSVDTLTILGSLDSVKRISLSAFDNGIPLQADSFNNVEIVLSKNHGFYTVIDLYLFPYHSPDTSAVVSEHYLASARLWLSSNGPVMYNSSLPGRRSSLFTLTDYIVPVPDVIYDWNVGDIFEYSQCAGASQGNSWSCDDPITYYLDTIVSKAVNNSGTEYFRRGWRATLSYVNGQQYYEFAPHSDTLLVPNTGNVFNTGLMPEEMDHAMLPSGPFPVDFYILNDTSHCATGNVYYRYIDNFPFFRPYYSYKTGIGLTHHNNGSDGTMTTDTTLLFSVRNGVMCGNFVMPDTSAPLAINGIAGNSLINVYPNPAFSELTVETSLDNHSLSLINAIGQVVYAKTSCNGKEMIDVRTLASGVYYLKLESADGAVVNKKIIIQN